VRKLRLLPLLLATACTSTPSFDPNARETPARVIDKKMVGAFVQEKADVSLPLFGFGKDRMTAIPVYEYSVREKDGAITNVRSEAPAFEIGHCVKLLYSIQPTYPRIAYGADCGEF